MEHPIPHQAPHVDAIHAAAKRSKVSKQRLTTRSNVYWIVGSIAAVGLVMALSSHSTPTQPELNHQADNNSDYSASLSANLRALSKQTPSQPDELSTDQHPFESPPLSKKIVARQNAPTSMYTAPAYQLSRNTKTEQTDQATLVGDSSNTTFANQSLMTTSVQAQRIAHPSFTIASGEFLHAILETAINSDLPGMVRAVVTAPVYAYTGERTLIPAGSRLIGQYSSGIVQGQNRVMVMWNRLILPNGVAVQLNSPGTDRLGRAGQSADSVNTHFIARFGESALLSLIGAGAATYGVNSSDQYNSAALYRAAVAQSFQQSAQKSLQNTLHIKPTLRIDQGANINVFVAHDLSFYHALASQSSTSNSLPPFINRAPYG